MTGSAASPRLACLDGWRGLAILLVTIGHFAPFPTGRLADAGVELFFVLSGRLMADLLIVRRQPLPDFFLRRASRVLPALAAFVLVCAIALAVPAIVKGGSAKTIGALAASGFVTNYLPQNAVVPAFEHTWSLAVEEHCYVALAIIALVVGRGRKAALIVAAALGVLATINGVRLLGLDSADTAYSYWRSDVRGASVLLSFAFYLAIRQVDAATLTRWALVVPACLAAGIAVRSLVIAEYWQATFGSAAMIVAVNLVDRAPAAFRRWFETRALTWLGLISFSFYLWQQPFMLCKSIAPWPVLLALSVGAAVLSYRNVERPMRIWLNARWSRPRREASVIALG
ncbi:MAG: acyltransferase [Pseudomonadota bacterium]